MTEPRSGYALCVRARMETPGQAEKFCWSSGRAVDTVMPGMWELPRSLRECPERNLNERLTVRHAIMQVNYVVRIRDVREDDVLEGHDDAGGERRWVPLREAAAMALTGLARKVLTRRCA